MMRVILVVLLLLLPLRGGATEVRYRLIVPDGPGRSDPRPLDDCVDSMRKYLRSGFHPYCVPDDADFWVSVMCGARDERGRERWWAARQDERCYDDDMPRSGFYPPTKAKP